MIIKYLQEKKKNQNKPVQKIKTGQPYVYEMLLTLFWLSKNLFHYPHQSIQGVKGFRQSIVTPDPRVSLSPSKEGGKLERSIIAFFTAISFHQVDMVALKGSPQAHLSCSGLYSQHTGTLNCG